MAPVYVSKPKKKACAEKAALIFEDEASFRQDSTLHRTWARQGRQPEVPVTGQRQSVKIFGGVELFSARFFYHRDTVFNAETYRVFLEQIARHYYPRRVILIQDNASYHNLTIGLTHHVTGYKIKISEEMVIDHARKSALSVHLHESP